jgi:hypothetical protein
VAQGETRRFAQDVGIPGSQAVPISRLHPTQEFCEVMQQRGQIVTAAWESVHKATCASLCLIAFVAMAHGAIGWAEMHA